MTITRIFQMGFESNGTGSTDEFDNAVGAFGSISSTYAKSGTYSFRAYAGAYGDKNIPATRQFRVGYHFFPKYYFNHTSFVALRTVSANLVSVNMKDETHLMLVVGSTEQDSCLFAVSALDFSHIGLDVKIDSSAGWAVVYIDGIEAMRFEGNTGDADAAIARFSVAGNEFCYYDDCFGDDTTGEAAAAVVPDRRFPFITPNGEGTHKEGLGSDGNNTDNYLLVDERPHDSDTTYVVLDTVDKRETNLMTTVTVPTGFTLAALIPVITAKKTDAEVGTQIAPLLRLSGTDLEGTAQDLPTSYGPIWERFLTKPGGGAWDQAGIDGVEVGYQGEGTF